MHTMVCFTFKKFATLQNKMKSIGTFTVFLFLTKTIHNISKKQDIMQYYCTGFKSAMVLICTLRHQNMKLVWNEPEYIWIVHTTTTIYW